MLFPLGKYSLCKNSAVGDRKEVSNVKQGHTRDTLTSPSQSTGQLTAKETTTNNCDGLDFPGNLLQPSKVVDLKEHLPPFPILSNRNSRRKHSGNIQWLLFTLEGAAKSHRRENFKKYLNPTIPHTVKALRLRQAGEWLSRSWFPAWDKESRQWIPGHHLREAVPRFPDPKEN